MLFFSDPEPTCEVESSGPIVQGQNVTLTCTMTYYHKSPRARTTPGAGMDASIIWEMAAGQLLSNYSSTVLNNDAEDPVGGTLEVKVVTLATGKVIPSYSCRSMFRFTDMEDPLFTFALNNVSWTCNSSPVSISCKYAYF